MWRVWAALAWAGKPNFEWAEFRAGETEGFDVKGAIDEDCVDCVRAFSLGSVGLLEAWRLRVGGSKDTETSGDLLVARPRVAPDRVAFVGFVPNRGASDPAVYGVAATRYLGFLEPRMDDAVGTVNDELLRADVFETSLPGTYLLLRERTVSAVLRVRDEEMAREWLDHLVTPAAGVRWAYAHGADPGDFTRRDYVFLSGDEVWRHRHLHAAANGDDLAELAAITDPAELARRAARALEAWSPEGHGEDAPPPPMDLAERVREAVLAGAAGAPAAADRELADALGSPYSALDRLPALARAIDAEASWSAARTVTDRARALAAWRAVGGDPPLEMPDAEARRREVAIGLGREADAVAGSHPATAAGYALSAALISGASAPPCDLDALPTVGATSSLLERACAWLGPELRRRVPAVGADAPEAYRALHARRDLLDGSPAATLLDLRTPAAPTGGALHVAISPTALEGLSSETLSEDVTTASVAVWEDTANGIPDRLRRRRSEIEGYYVTLGGLDPGWFVEVRVNDLPHDLVTSTRVPGEPIVWTWHEPRYRTSRLYKVPGTSGRVQDALRLMEALDREAHVLDELLASVPAAVGRTLERPIETRIATQGAAGRGVARVEVRIGDGAPVALECAVRGATVAIAAWRTRVTVDGRVVSDAWASEDTLRAEVEAAVEARCVADAGLHVRQAMVAALSKPPEDDPAAVAERAWLGWFLGDGSRPEPVSPADLVARGQE